MSLAALASCFQGLLPAQLFTCSSDGVPNAAYLSHVEYVDAEHVALSFQFFNKSRRNIAENPHAVVMVIDPDTGQGWNLTVRYVRSETEGPLFVRMALRIEAIASFTNLKGVFKLRAADVYRVTAIEPAPEELGAVAVPGHAPGDCLVVFSPRAVCDVVERAGRAESLDAFMDDVLAGIESSLGFRHALLLMPTEQEGVLITVATRGYPHNGVGAEVRYGEGIGGFVAEARQPIRLSGLVRGMLYALAMHRRAGESELVRRTRQIPVPGLDNPDSQLGIPLMVRDELVGVLCLESERPYRYHEDDKALVQVLGTCLALAIQRLQWHERSADVPAEPGASAHETLPPAERPRETASPRPALHLTYHVEDACILMGNEYLIRGLPATILWRLLRVHEATGRVEFTNRELRLDKSLNLPAWKDNLESRLILLRRRLQQKCPDIALVPRGRGRFGLELTCPIVLGERP
jgi:adenylate cyclase